MNAVHQLAQRGLDDLRLVSRMVDLFIAASHCTREEAHRRLSAFPEPETHQETRERIRAVCDFISNRAGR